MTSSDPRAILISGCSTGFGFRAARELARRGHTVLAGLREPEGRNRTQADGLNRAAADAAGRLVCLTLDVDRDDSVHAAVEQALVETDGRLDVVVNTAAYSVMGPLEACQPAQLLSMLDTNVVGALRLYRAVLPIMRRAGRGRIIQITSGLGRVVIPFMGPYAVSAWAQECFAEALFYEAAAFGIEVAILEPSAYQTELGGPSVKLVGDADRLAAYQEQLVAFGERVRVEMSESEEGDPEEVARAVADACEAPGLPLRTPVGESARQLVALREQHTTGEFSRVILERTGLLPFKKT